MSSQISENKALFQVDGRAVAGRGLGGLRSLIMDSRSQPSGYALPPEAARISTLVSEVVASDPRILGLYLFGSRARGEEHRGSDVDLGVLFKGPVDVWQVVELEDRLEKAIGLRVDLVSMGQASPFLALDIVRGERLYASDAESCDHFDLFVLRRAADLAPFERQRRASLQRATSAASR